MQPDQSLASIEFNLDQHEVILHGNWTLAGITQLTNDYKKLAWPQDQTLTINCADIKKMDSAGAWQLYHCQQELEQRNNKWQLVEFESDYQKLFELILNETEKIKPVKPRVKPEILYRLGEATCKRLEMIDGFIIMIGELTLNIAAALSDWRRFQFPSIVNVIEQTGYRALPIIALLSFLIGVVLAYQMGLQLETYGANIFIVYLTGMAIFREFAPLITAIIVAGRTSSSFTAQIGTMKVNQEIDALLTMGLSPTERLVLPKVFGLLIALPLLILWSDLFGMLGSMVMSKFMLGINYINFLHRLKETITVSNYWIGLSKAPTFSLIIAAVGCYQGFLVTHSADSVGVQTTKSVVQALFLIIIADAAFSVFYSWLGI